MDKTELGGGIAKVYLIDPKTDGRTPVYIVMSPDLVKDSKPFRPSVTMNIKSEKREYWQQLGYNSREEMYKNGHMHNNESPEPWCYTHNCYLNECLKKVK